MTADKPRSTPGTDAPILPEMPNWLCLSLLAALTLGIFWQVLVLKPDEVLSDSAMDLSNFFVHWRYFGFHELRSGNLALWNPHCSSGTPFFGNFQSALLYPLNFLYLVLPLAPAINWTIALHVFLAGVFTFYWMRHRGLHSLACLLSAVMFMFCGPHFLQVHAGHLPNLCTLIWAPLLFLAIDQLVDLPSLAPCLLGMFSVAMSVMAGHPQYVFYMGVTAGVYSLLQVVGVQQRWKVILGLGAMALGGIALSAVQLFTGLQEGSETMRSLGMEFASASTYSFPPENFLTLVTPWFFGDMKGVPYWGRWYITETSLFVSVGGLALAVYGIVRGKAVARRFSITMLFFTLVLALGSYTPVFSLLFDYVPGFSSFRGMDKFLWLAALFLSVLAGIGMNEMIQGQKAPRWLVAGAASMGAALCLLAFLPGRLDWWARVVQSIPATGASTYLFSDFDNPRFIALSSSLAVYSLIRGAVCLFAAAFLLGLAASRRNIACLGVFLLAATELAVFAGHSLATFQISAPYSAEVNRFLTQHPGDYRIIYPNPNSGMTADALDIEGADPAGLLRYRRFLNFAEGLDIDSAPDALIAQKFDANALRMLRYRLGISVNQKYFSEFGGGLPHLLLVDRFRLLTNYLEIFSTLTNADFKMDEEVILESRPSPLPQPASGKGTVKLLNSSTDYLTIEANVGAPALLLITDSYSRGWRALPLPGSTQTHYEVMPANYCLRAIPLAAGHHLLRVEYSPLGFRIGKVVSIAALAVFLTLTGLVLKNRLRQSPLSAPSAI